MASYSTGPCGVLLCSLLRRRDPVGGWLVMLVTPRDLVECCFAAIDRKMKTCVVYSAFLLLPNVNKRKRPID